MRSRVTTLYKYSRPIPSPRVRSPIFHRNISTKIATLKVEEGTVLKADNGESYKLSFPLNANGPDGAPPSVWIARGANGIGQYVVKQPRQQDSEAEGWPLFAYELMMLRLFKDDHFIRPLVGIVPSSEAPDGKPRMVLKAMEKTLWEARLVRPLTSDEIKWIMKGVLCGLFQVHSKTLTFTGSTVA